MFHFVARMKTKIPELDIVEVISSYLTLKPEGDNFVTLCPLHDEKHPSFFVVPSKQRFHCFGCHKGGDVFRFIQDYEGISFLESVAKLEIPEPKEPENLPFFNSDKESAKSYEDEVSKITNIVGSAALCKACMDEFDYALQLKSGTVIRFTKATILNREWLHLQLWHRQEDQPPINCLPFLPERGIDVRISDIVWVIDAPKDS